VTERAPFSPGLWPQEIRFFPHEPSFADPIQARLTELPPGQMSAWASSHPGCGIFFCTGPGAVMARVGHEEYLLREGWGVLVPPGAPFCWFAERERSGMLGVLFRQGELLADMEPAEMAGFFAAFRFGKKGGLLIKAEKNSRIVIEGNLQAMLPVGGVARQGRGLRRKLRLVEIILQLVDRRSNGVDRGKLIWRQEDWDRLPAVVSYLHQRHNEELYAQQIQKALRLPKDYLATTFPLIMGQRWNQYLLEYRIRRAAAHLLQDRARISAAALESGFSTLSHFNSSFRKVTGLSPRDFVSGRRT